MKKKTDHPSGARTALGFAYNRDTFEALVEDVLAMARKLGATDASAEVSESTGLSVSVRKGQLETVERNRDKSLGINLFLGQCRGNASTSDFSKASLEQTVRAAFDIARFTAQDPMSGLPDEKDLAMGKAARRELDLFHPWDLTAERAAQLALRAESAALAVDKRITNSEGASVSAQQSHFFMGNSKGFRGGYASSRHGLSVSPIAGRGNDMQRDYWYTSERDVRDMAQPESIGRYAAKRVLSRLKSRKIATCEVPVLFENTLAAGLLGTYVQATSGDALYRKTTFLEGCLGQSVFPKHIDIFEDPHIIKGIGSSAFDDEGVLTRPRKVVKGGITQGYFLSSYSARKLGMQNTGHAGGSHNLFFSSRLTQPNDNLRAMLKKLGRGLFVTELMGQGVNYVTGDYSRGAAGFWVENGAIAYPVNEITIAGHMNEMLKQIIAVGSDSYTYGNKTIGSVLIERMKVAGL